MTALGGARRAERADGSQARSRVSFYPEWFSTLSKTRCTIGKFSARVFTPALPHHLRLLQHQSHGSILQIGRYLYLRNMRLSPCSFPKLKSMPRMARFIAARRQVVGLDFLRALNPGQRPAPPLRASPGGPTPRLLELPLGPPKQPNPACVWRRAQLTPYNVCSATLARCAVGHDRPESAVTIAGIHTRRQIPQDNLPAQPTFSRLKSENSHH